MKQTFSRSSSDADVSVAAPAARVLADLPATAPSVSYFSTGSASPVSTAWLMNRSRDASRRTSAGIMSPADRCTMSPVTTSRIGTSRRAGSDVSVTERCTVAVVRTIAFSFSAARSDRNSCEKRSSALIVTIVSRIVMPT